MRQSKNYLPNSMSSRPGYTSGRGATTTDLDSKKLSFIYDKIRENESIDAADNFVQMVKNLQIASCTEFLVSLYKLEDRGWKYDDSFFGKSSNDVYVENEGEAIGTIFSAFGGGIRHDDTLSIVSKFLRQHNESHITMGNSNSRDHYGCFYE